MFGMHRSIKPGQLRPVIGALVLVIHSSTSFASGLTLAAAESLALAEDPGVHRIQASRQALDELSVAAEQLPDPMLKVGLVSFPTDTFNLGQEAMTQVQVGVIQKFPRGNTRELRSAQIGLKSQGLDRRRAGPRVTDPAGRP